MRNKGLSFYKKKKKISQELLREIFSWIFGIALSVFLAAVVVIFLGKSTRVVGMSMEPTLENGQQIFIDRFLYVLSSPKAGDVVAFLPNGNENSHYYIKRIIALPGESVEIVENSVYINGEKLQEDYETSKIDDVGIVNEKIKLGSDEYFVLGDDRQNSEDSRNANVGNVKYSYIYGKAWFVISPKSHFGFVKE